LTVVQAVAVSFFFHVGAGRRLYERARLLVADALLQLKLDQREDLEGDERVDKRLSAVIASDRLGK
jgi:hypothetical protein